MIAGDVWATKTQYRSCDSEKLQNTRNGHRWGYGRNGTSRHGHHAHQQMFASLHYGKFRFGMLTHYLRRIEETFIFIHWQIQNGKLFVPGSIKIAKAATIDHPELMQLAIEVTDECKDIVEPDRCELADKLSRCIHDASMKRGVDPRTFNWYSDSS